MEESHCPEKGQVFRTPWGRLGNIRQPMSKHGGRVTPCFKTKSTAGGTAGCGGLLESWGAAGRLRRKVGKSAFTAAEAPSRGRQPLPQAASQGAGGMRSSVR